MTAKPEAQALPRFSSFGVYNLYSGTVFEGSYLSPSQVILLLRGICKGETSAQIAKSA